MSERWVPQETAARDMAPATTCRPSPGTPSLLNPQNIWVTHLGGLVNRTAPAEVRIRRRIIKNYRSYRRADEALALTNWGGG